MALSRSFNAMMLTAALMQIAQAAPRVETPAKPGRTKPRSRMSIEREQKRRRKQDFPTSHR